MGVLGFLSRSLHWVFQQVAHVFPLAGSGVFGLVLQVPLPAKSSLQMVIVLSVKIRIVASRVVELGGGEVFVDPPAPEIDFLAYGHDRQTPGFEPVAGRIFRRRGWSSDSRGVGFRRRIDRFHLDLRRAYLVGTRPHSYR